MPGVDILEETLLVKVGFAGVDRHGNPKLMAISRYGYEQQKGDLDLTIIKVLKPAGVTSKEHEAGVTPEEREKAAAENAMRLEMEAKHAEKEALKAEIRAELEAEAAAKAKVEAVEIPSEKEKAAEPERKLTPGQKAAITRKKNAEAKRLKAEAEAAAKDAEIGGTIETE